MDDGRDLDRITFELSKMGGGACIRRLRITVALVVSRVAEGATIDRLLPDYPDSGPEDIRQALAYAAGLASEQVVTA